jgi:hypothetical protein
MERLADHAPNLCGALPNLMERVKDLGTKDPAYLVQEYNNNFWQPVFVSQMIEELAAVKLSYLGTATLPEVFDAVLPTPIRELLAEQSVAVIREQLRDYASNQQFRRDLYVKGQRKPWPVDQHSAVESYRLTINELTVRPPFGDPYIFRAGANELKGEWSFNNGILERLETAANKHLSVGEIIEGGLPEQRGSVVASVTMLLHGGWLLPYSDQSDGSGRACNQVLGSAVLAGAPYRFVSTPRAGGAISMTDTDWFLFDAYLRGMPETEWPHYLDTALKRLGREILNEGKVVTEPKEKESLQVQLLVKFKKETLPFLLRVGAT